jgi:hypothetical protein
VAPRRDLIIRDEEGNAITQDWSPINEYERVSKDLSIDMAYGFYSKLGWFEPGINYYRVLELHDQYSSELESVDFVGTSRGPDDYRLRGRIAWRRNDWSALLGINYTPDYQNNQVEIADGGPAAQHKVDSYTTADLTMAYRAKSGLTLRAGGMNITDADFPLAILDRQIAGASPYDPSRVDPRGRVLFFEMEYEF